MFISLPRKTMSPLIRDFVKSPIGNDKSALNSPPPVAVARLSVWLVMPNNGDLFTNPNTSVNGPLPCATTLTTATLSTGIVTTDCARTMPGKPTTSAVVLLTVKLDLSMTTSPLALCSSGQGKSPAASKFLGT